MPSFAAHLPKRNLISVRRQDVDGYRMQRFLVGLADRRVALVHVDDVELDGLLVLRRSDITEVRRTATDEFQERLLKREGIRPGKQWPTSLALDGWQSVIAQMAECHPFMILEREL